MATPETTPTETGKGQDNPASAPGPAPTHKAVTTKRPPRPLYLSWRLWFLISLILLIVGGLFFLIIGPQVFYAILAAGIAWITGSGVWGLVTKFIWPPLWEEIKRNREDNKRTEEKTDTNTEDITWLRTQYEALGRQYLNINKMYEMVVNDLQQERTESKLVTAELKTRIEALTRQNHQQQGEIDRQKKAHQVEIAVLKEEIRLLGVEKSSDKEKIVKLEGQVQQLQERVKELETWGSNLEKWGGDLESENKRLLEENHDLKIGQLRRRSTDQLPGLTPEAEARLNQFEAEKEQKNQQS